MGNSKYLDNLSKSQYKELTDKLLDIQKHKCFICREEILEGSDTNIDHIIPLNNKGEDKEYNFAVTHEHCNKSKQDADLNVARMLNELEKIKKIDKENNNSTSLKQILKYYGGSEYDFIYKVDKDEIKYSFDKIDTTIKTSKILTDSLSGERTVFIEVPIEYLYHDEIINPRGLNSNISKLIKEFYNKNPQLHLSLARIDDNKIKIFDGQHKSVAQIMNGVKTIPVRLFIEPDVNRLILTNKRAGKELVQVAFDKSIIRQLHGTVYAERIKQYQKDHNLSNEDYSFSEKTLSEYYRGDKFKTTIIDNQKNCIYNDNNNKLRDYINSEGRNKDLPLSYSTFEKTFLSKFVPKILLDTPLDYGIDEGINPRQVEREQLVNICNILAEEILIGRYNEDIGTHRIENSLANNRGEEITDEHLVAYRVLKEEIMYNFVDYLDDVIRNYFAYVGTKYDKEKLFQNKFDNQLWINITNFVRNWRDFAIWKNRELSATIFSGKQNKDYWSKIFKTGKAPDGTNVLPSSLNINDLIKRE